MINKKTLLILGAGSSMDYGFPSGRELLEDIHNFIRGKLHRTILGHGSYFSDPKPPIVLLASLCCIEFSKSADKKKTFKEYVEISNSFIKLLFNSSTASVDDFLARIQHNKPEYWEEYIFIGKVLIVLLISQYQQDRMFTYKGNHYLDDKYSNHRYSKAKFTDSNSKGNVVHSTDELINGWYDDLWKKIYEGCKSKEDLKRSLSNLEIVTFNYDVSLEYFLKTRIANMFSCSESESEDILSQLHIHHVYGFLSSYSQLNTGVLNELFQHVAKDHTGKTNIVDDFASVIESLDQLKENEKIYSKTKNNLDNICNTAKGILTYEETEEINKLKISSKMKQELTKVEEVFFLGFGYLEQNLDFLQKNVLIYTKPNYFGTMYGIGKNSMWDILNRISKHEKKTPSPNSVTARNISWLGFNIKFITTKAVDLGEGFDKYFYNRYPEFNKMKISDFFSEVRSIS